MAPSALEAQFWASDYYQNAKRVLDRWSIYVTLFMHAALLVWQRQNLLGNGSSLRVLRALVFMLWALSRLYWSDKYPSSYWRCRPYLMWFNKLFTLANVVVTAPLTVRHMIRTQTASDLFMGSCLNNWLKLPSFLNTTKTVICTSANMVVIMEAVNPPLPFTEQAALHAVYAAALSILHLHGASHALLPTRQALESGCRSTNRVLLVFLGLIASIDPLPSMEHLINKCDRSAIQIWLVFTNLFAGFTLPVYISYRLDQHLRQQYLLLQATASTSQATTSNNSAPAPAAPKLTLPLIHWGDLRNIMALAVSCWCLAVLAYQPLATAALPL